MKSFSVAAALVCLALASLGPAHGRTFTNNSGKKIEAVVVSKTDTHVRLKTPRGKTYTVKLDTLSAEDQAYVRAWKKKEETDSRLVKADLAEVMAAKGFTKVDFDEEMNHLFVDVMIDGKKARLLLDTGAMATIIKTSSVEKFDLEMKAANVQAGGVGGGAQIKGKVDVEKLELGGDAAGRQTFYVMDLAHLPQNYANNLDGILGGDFFKEKKALFDYSGGVLWLKLK